MRGGGKNALELNGGRSQINDKRGGGAKFIVESISSGKTGSTPHREGGQIGGGRNQSLSIGTEREINAINGRGRF